MKLREIIPQYNITFNEVFKSLVDLYNVDNSFREDYEKVFNFIKYIDKVSLQPKDIDFEIELMFVKDDIDDEEYVDVSGYKDGSYVGIEFVPWVDWCNAKLTESTMTFPPIEIIAHCIYEMSFISYDEIEIQDTLERISNQIKEIENSEFYKKLNH